jgi:predicted RNase H-like HicB family nuclease
VTVYHVKVEFDDGWYIGRVLERPGITTQGRTLDELVAMVRDAIDRMWGEKKVSLELILPMEGAVSRRVARRKRVA